MYIHTISTSSWAICIVQVHWSTKGLHFSAFHYIHSTSNVIHTDGARASSRAKTGGHKGIRGDRRHKGREDTQWRQDISLYNIKLRTFAD